jgi:predicted transcriptional regulator
MIEEEQTIEEALQNLIAMGMIEVITDDKTGKPAYILSDELIAELKDKES